MLTATEEASALERKADLLAADAGAANAPTADTRWPCHR
jgi:hypothetical protein